MKSIFAAILAVAATVASAQSNIVSITSPLTGTVYTAGQPAIISWIDQTVDVIPKITLAKGDPNALQPLATIAENVDATKGTYTWNVPSDTSAGTDYAFELGTSPNISFTGLFTIQNNGGGSSSNSTAIKNIAPDASPSYSAVADTVAQQQVAQTSSAAGLIAKANVAAIAIAGSVVAAVAALI